MKHESATVYFELNQLEVTAIEESLMEHGARLDPAHIPNDSADVQKIADAMARALDAETV